MRNFTILLVLLSSMWAFAQVGVNTLTPNAMMEISSSTNGFLIPRIALTGSNVAAPVINPQGGGLLESTLVYNTATVAGVNGVSPGFYYWNGTRWVSFTGNGSRDWSLNGNSGITTPAFPVTYGVSKPAANENFLGNTDANDVVFVTNNLERMRVRQSTGHLGVGIAGALYRAHIVDRTAGTYTTVSQNSYVGDIDGVGVYGQATNNPGYGYGIIGEGRYMGVRGINDGLNYTSNSFGGYFSTAGTAGNRYGVFATAQGSATASNFGGYFNATGGANNYGLVVANGNVGVGTTAPQRARFQTQGFVGNTVATFNAAANSLGVALVSDWPGVYFNSYYNGGIRQMSGGDYPGILNFNPTAGQFDFALSNTANTVAGNLTAGAFANRFSINRDTGATLFYQNATATGLNVVSGGFGTNLGWFTLGAIGATPEPGKGITAAGGFVGVEGRSNYVASPTIDRMGGLFYTSSNTGITAVATIGSVVDNVVYKILGFGTVNTLVQDNEGQERIMTAPESPETLFQDYGIGQLVNGYAKINLDPILTKNILVDETHPLKVFIQLEGECNGVYVFNKTASSFEVKELQSGNSNISFSYQIVANRADEVRNGHLSKYSDMRFKPLGRELKVVEKDMNFESQLDRNMTPFEPEIVPVPNAKEVKLIEK